MVIGFGDFVPTFQKHQEHEFGIFFIFYELFILCWFIAGTYEIGMKNIKLNFHFTKQIQF